MQPQQSYTEKDQNGAVVCTQCGAPMPREMRFCRSCGNRLGEGPAEYTETVRFADASSGFRGAPQYFPGGAPPIARRDSSTIYAPKKKRLRGMTWVWIMIGLLFLGSGGMSMLVKNVGRIPRTATTAAASRSYVGVDGFKTTDGGVTFDVVQPPDSPADKAGLVGGDIVTSFDGRPVKTESEIMDLLAQIPIGKNVEVIYTRDGNFYNTRMTTVSRDEYNRLDREYSNRPEGKGYFGFESFRMTRITNPETKTFGVRINYVERNGPADLFGIKEGDIITDFDKVAIRTSDEFLSRVRRATPHSSVNITVLRDGQRLVIPVTIGKA